MGTFPSFKHASKLNMRSKTSYPTPGAENQSKSHYDFKDGDELEI